MFPKTNLGHFTFALPLNAGFRPLHAGVDLLKSQSPSDVQEVHAYLISFHLFFSEGVQEQLYALVFVQLFYTMKENGKQHKKPETTVIQDATIETLQLNDRKQVKNKCKG